VKRRRNNKKANYMTKVFVCVPNDYWIELLDTTGKNIVLGLVKYNGDKEKCIFTRNYSTDELNNDSVVEKVRELCKVLVGNHKDSGDPEVRAAARSLAKVSTKLGLIVWKKRGIKY
jgi:dynactin complex subunit